MKSVFASLAFFVLTFGAAAPGAAQTAPGLEVRFCPETVARAYPLDTLHGVQGLLLQNIAVVNRGPAPAEVTGVTIELLRGGEVIDSRLVQGAALQAALKSGQGLKAAGVLDAFGFQFCDGRLLAGAQPAASAAMGQGESLLILQQPFAFKGARDQVRVRVSALAGGKPIEAAGLLPIDATTSKTVFRWPLGTGQWLVAAGASFHTTHRWGVPEEFALDLIQIGPNGLGHRGDGARLTDFYIYGAPVLAAADGVVAAVVKDAPEDPPLLRRPGETMEDYFGRIAQAQDAHLAAGGAAISGAMVIIDHGNGEFSVYVHLKPGSPGVTVGQAVKAGQVIGLVGSSGNSTEPHLHFQVCDRAQMLSCAGIPATFVGIDLPQADGPRPLQSGDVVVAP